jgi:PAS domain S-box-containing protein
MSVGAAAVGRSESVQIVAQQAAIAQIGQSALVHASLDELFDEACALISRVLETELVSVVELLPGDGGLKVVAGVGWKPGVVGELVIGNALGSQAGYTIETGSPVVVADTATEQRFHVSDSLIDHDVISGMSVRIGESENPYGVLSAFTGRRGRFTHDDTNFLQAVANVLAAAVVRFRSEEEVRSSRDQLAAIVSTIDEGITVRGPSSLLFANDAAAKLTGYASADELVNASSEDLFGRYELFGEDGRPMAVEDLPSRRAAAGEDKPEGIVGFRIRATGETHWSVVRATAIRDAKGDITHVVNIFREVTEERRTRDARLFMADAVAVLSSTLDTEEAARRLADLAVPRLADYCTVHMRTSDGGIANVALTHADPSRVGLARRLQEIRPIDPDARTGVPRVIREGTSELIEVTPELLETASAVLSPEEMDMLRKLEMHWYLSVPLMGRAGPIGALGLVMAESGRSLGQRDLELAEELGARAGIALENAQLYQAVNDRRVQVDAVLGAMAEGVLVFGSDGRLELANSAATAMFKGALPADQNELHQRIGLGADQHEHNSQDEADALELQVDHGPRWIEVRRYRTAGGELIAEDGPRPTVIVLRDVTEARSARAARDAFLGVLSHELRTPITTIYGGSELLERGLPPERQKEVMTDIRIESERLARLVEDLLVMTRIERGTVEIGEEPILVQRLVPSVVHAFGLQWPDVKVSLDIAARLSAVRGDPTYVEQVVRNLLTNAVRYGRGAESGVEILAEEGAEEVIVRVRDRGDGFGTTEPEQLFELFFRSDAARAVPGGAGIGLFVCRHLIEAMGGRIWALPRDGGGSEFGFTLQVLETDLAG